MIMVNGKTIDDMNVGELEIAYIERLKARKGGFIMIWLTLPFLLLSAHFHVLFFIIFFAICMMLWSFGTLSLHNDVVQLRDKLNEIYGVDND